MTETKNDADPASAVADQKAADLAVLKRALDESDNQNLRLRAEFDNYRKRVEREKSDARRWGKEEVVLRLVSLMDVMEQAEAVAHKSPDLMSVVLGLDMLYREFKKLLKDEGLEEIAPEVGADYDHAVHEAVESVPDDGKEDRVLGLFQKGYRLAGNLIRPARVKVSCKHSPEKSDN